MFVCATVFIFPICSAHQYRLTSGRGDTHRTIHTIAANRLLHMRQIFSCPHFFPIFFPLTFSSSSILFHFFFTRIVFMVSWIHIITGAHIAQYTRKSLINAYVYLTVCVCVCLCEWNMATNLCPSIADAVRITGYLAFETTPLAIHVSWTCHCQFIRPQTRHIAFFFVSFALIRLAAAEAASRSGHNLRKYPTYDVNV